MTTAKCGVCEVRFHEFWSGKLYLYSSQHINTGQAFSQSVSYVFSQSQYKVVQLFPIICLLGKRGKIGDKQEELKSYQLFIFSICCFRLIEILTLRKQKTYYQSNLYPSLHPCIPAKETSCLEI